MYINAIDMDESEWESAHIASQQPNFGERNACILDSQQLLCSLPFETRIKDPLSIQPRGERIQPMMHRCTGGSVTVTRTDSDGSSTSVSASVSFETEDAEETSQSNENNESENSNDE